MFEVGDKIVRTDEGWKEVKPNTVYTVWMISRNGGEVVLKECPELTCMSDKFRLVDTFTDNLPEDLFTL